MTRFCIWLAIAAAIPCGVVGADPATPETVPTPLLGPIIWSPGAPAHVQLAAREVRRYVYLRTGKLPGLGESGAGIRLETDAGLEAEQYRLRTEGATTVISGGSALGVLYGAYRYAELLGVRFYLDGDVVPDQRLEALPFVNDTGKPEFALRGILPFHDFPEGPDLWEADDYKSVLAQLVKLRMNFIGLHTYTECGWGSEPTVWLGLPEDVNDRGEPQFSYAAHYFSTARDASGHTPRKVDDMLFGGSLLFESDPWGPSVMRGLMPEANTPADKNLVFNRAGELLREAFTYARRFGIKTCVGTEVPLTHPERLLPRELKARLNEKGLSVADPATRRALYRGTFRRAARTYPLDYYWLWTPESWRGPQPDAVVTETQDDLLAAVEAVREVGAPFTLATAGWTLGPSKDRTLFDRVLPKDMPFSCINLELGTVPVDAGFARLEGRPGWAIPWLEDDLSMSSPQLWVGRILRDAYDARHYGCQGLMGIHWRTAEVGPMVAALAQAQWQVGRPIPTRPARGAVSVDGGAVASFDAPVADTDLDPVYQTVRHDVNAYNYLADPGPTGTPRYLPADAFYLDWARHQFGEEAAPEISAIFARIDGYLPAPAPHCPGGIAVNGAPWETARKAYAFVDQLSALRPRIRGTGNQARYDRWLKSFAYLRAIGRVSCACGALDQVMADVAKASDSVARQSLARDAALPARIELQAAWREMVTLCLETADTWGSIGQVCTHEMYNRGQMALLERHDAALGNALGQELPPELDPDLTYHGTARLVVPTARSVVLRGETLALKIIVLDRRPVKSVTVHHRPMGGSRWQNLAATHQARGVWQARLPRADEDYEYYIAAESAESQTLRWPPTAPELNHTVVVSP